MGVESFLLSSCVKMIVAQRLVRVLCQECKTMRPLSDAEASADPRYGQLGFSVGDAVYHPTGCEWCGSSGYRGRRGLFEVLPVSAGVRRAVTPRCESAEIEKLARDEGMTTMVEDGVAKCRAGLTTIDEVFRVTMSV
jgi:general secretion pathway protein E